VQTAEQETYYIMHFKTKLGPKYSHYACRSLDTPHISIPHLNSNISVSTKSSHAAYHNDRERKCHNYSTTQENCTPLERCSSKICKTWR